MCPALAVETRLTCDIQNIAALGRLVNSMLTTENAIEKKLRPYSVGML
jgi:hypothetical protein